MRRSAVLQHGGHGASVSNAHSGRWGARSSEVASKFEGFKMMNSPLNSVWRHKTVLQAGAWYGWHPISSWQYPKGLRGAGIEYRKFFGAQQTLMPQNMGGPQEAYHDENRNRVFHNDMAAPDVPRAVRHLGQHITTRSHSHYQIPIYSVPALRTIASSAYEASQRKLIWNPHVPQQPVEGPAEIPSNELEVLRKQAFLAGIEFPEFPDVRPVEQRDPWEDHEDEYKVPEVDNDRLLDAVMWEEVNKNMRGMEAKVRAFKDVERKKIWAWKQTKLTQDLKKARLEETYLQAHRAKVNKEAFDEKKKSRMQQWQGKMGASGRIKWRGRKKGDDDEEEEPDFFEDYKVEVVSELGKKEQKRMRREVLRHGPSGFAN